MSPVFYGVGSRRYQKKVGAISGLALVGSLLLALWGRGDTLECGGIVKMVQVAVVVIWTLLPPIWFWYEFYFLRPEDCVPMTPAWEQFKYGQDITSKIWLAATSALLILYFWKDIGRK